MDTKEVRRTLAEAAIEPGVRALIDNVLDELDRVIADLAVAAEVAASRRPSAPRTFALALIEYREAAVLAEPDTADSASRQHYIDTGDYLTKADTAVCDCDAEETGLGHRVGCALVICALRAEYVPCQVHGIKRCTICGPVEAAS